MAISTAELARLLDKKVEQFNRPSFIDKDPISIPHRFSQRQDIEIMGFWTAILAWGQRSVILKKASELLEYMEGAPYDFILNHQESDLKRFLTFKHRTFNSTDALYFLHFLHHYYQHHESLEEAFIANLSPADWNIQKALEHFHNRFCCDPFVSQHTCKHIATPARQSSCKRLTMFLRWMVRHDDRGVDFGLWKRIRPSQLVMPIDVHVGRVARKLGLLIRPKTDWQAAIDLTEALRQFDSDDPVKYDFALFGLGVKGEM